MPDRSGGSVSASSWRHWLSRHMLAWGGQWIRWAWQLAPAPTVDKAPAAIELEFCCEAGGPDGALYLNGQLLGTLAGVQRL
jgi:hypothetical protein